MGRAERPCGEPLNQLEEHLAGIRRNARNFALSAQLGDQPQAISDLYGALEDTARAIENLSGRVEMLAR